MNKAGSADILYPVSKMYNKKVIAGLAAAEVGLAAGGGFIASQNAANAERQEAIDVCLNSMNETRDLMAQVGDIYRPLTHHIQTGLSTNGNLLRPHW